MKKSIIAAVIILVLAFGWGEGAHASQKAEEPPFQIQAEYGYGGYTRYGTSIPVRLEVTNQGKDFEGQVLLVHQEDSYSDRVGYAQDLILGSGGSKQMEFLLPVINSYGDMEIIFQNGAGKQIYQKKAIISTTFTDDIFMGMLTDDYNGLNYMDRIGTVKGGLMAGKKLRLVDLTKEGISHMEGSLDMFTVIIVNNYDTALLETSQAEVLKNWVQKGGTLLIGTGSHYQKTLGMFQDDFLVGDIGSLQTVPIGFEVGKAQISPGLSETEEAFGEEGSGEDETVLDLLQITVEGSRAYDDLGMQVVKRGAGQIAVVSFDLSDERFSEWAYVYEAAENLLSPLFEEAVQITDASAQMSYWSIRSMISNTINEDMPRFRWFVILIGLYIAALPVLYIILKRMDKRHFIWICVPALAVLFSMVIYGLGAGTRRREPFFNYAAIITLGKEGSTKEVDFVAVTSPANKPYGFSVSDAYHINAVSSEAYSSQEEGCAIALKQAVKGTEVSVLKSQSYGTKYFAAEKYGVELGEVEVNLSYQGGSCTGYVTNHTEYELTDAGIITPFGVITLEGFQPGETKEVQTGGRSMHAYANMYTIADLLIPYPYQGTEDADRVAKYNMIHYGAMNGVLSLQQGSSFVAFVKGSTPQIMEEQTYGQSGLTLVVKNFDIQMEAENQTFLSGINNLAYVTDGDIYNYNSGWDAEYWLSSPEGVMEYRFQENFKPDMIQCMYDEYGSFPGELEIYFYNWDTLAYDRMSELEAGNSVELHAYMNEDNVLQVRYCQIYTGGDNLLPAYVVFGTEE